MISEKIITKIKKRLLTRDDYIFQPVDPYNMDLLDNVVMWFDGSDWKIAPISVSLSYPIIYDIFLDDTEKYDVSIVVCPITLRSVMFKGKFEFHSYEDYRMILKEDNDFLPIDLNKKINKKLIIQDNKRIEVKIMTLRNAIIYAPDAQFMKCEKEIKMIIDKSYYINDKDISGNELKIDFIHPKTLVYVVHYNSNTTKEDRYSILLGNDYNKDTITGYDVVNSGLNDHLTKYRSKIINKDGYIMPMLWYIAKIVYKKFKIVALRRSG